jgi:hypothetical protein
MSEFLVRNFTYKLGEPAGHINLYGDYTLHSIEFVGIATLVPEQEVLT